MLLVQHKQLKILEYLKKKQHYNLQVLKVKSRSKVRIAIVDVNSHGRPLTQFPRLLISVVLDLKIYVQFSLG